MPRPEETMLVVGVMLNSIPCRLCERLLPSPLGATKPQVLHEVDPL
jgi:hypothetical protein